jgi:hypothetical protein
MDARNLDQRLREEDVETFLARRRRFLLY